MSLSAINKLFRTRTQSVVQTVVRYLHKKDPQVIFHLRQVYMCNVESEFDDIPSIKQRFSERGLKPQIDLFDLKQLYALLRRQTLYYIKLQETLLHFESATECRFEKKKLTVPKPVDKMNEAELKKYYVLQQIDDFEKCFLRLRTYVLYHCFSLPNELHANTPKGDVDHIVQLNVSKKVNGQNHIEVGHRLGVLEYSNPASYYLLNEAANLEIALQKYLSELLSKELNFKPFRNPDTCHDFLMKGIYVDNFKNEGFVLQGSIYRLVGGASFASFCAYKAATSAHGKFMPERFFTCGRRYIPPNDSTDRGLYSVVQRSNIQALIATATEEEMYLEYKNTLEWLISLYERLGLNFRVCNKRASALHLSESLRTTIQLYSVHRKEFVDAAHISFSGDFVSQRIHILNHDKDENSFTTWLLDVAVLSVPIVLANILEQSKDKLFIPDCLIPYMYKTPISRQTYK